MKLAYLYLAGFGKFADTRVDFDPGFNVVYGPNEAGKSTLATAVCASLYGLPRKEEREAWKPWSGAPFATTLAYELQDGRAFEVQRDYEREPKGVRVFDENGADVSASVAAGKAVNPGLAHLQIPYEVFVNASCLVQGVGKIDGSRAERISAALARALDGGPREDAALGAIQRLDDAVAEHVGTKRATVNAPLRHLTERIAEQSARAEEMRAALRALTGVRARLEEETARAAEFAGLLREHERTARALRAHALRSRLDSLREIRDDLSVLAAERAQYDDVEEFPSARVATLEALHRTWVAASAAANQAEIESREAGMSVKLRAELDERAYDGGALDDDAFAALEAAAATAREARDRTTFAADQAQQAERSLGGGSEWFGAIVASALFVLLGAGGLAIAQMWVLCAIAGALFVAIAVVGFSRASARRRAARTWRDMQRVADEAAAAERASAAAVAATLEPLGVVSIEELQRRRARYRELHALRERELSTRARASELAERARAAGDAFDAVARELTPPAGSRDADLAAVKVRESRRSARDGIDVRLSMLDVRRGDVLGDDDEFTLETELAELLAAGVRPAPLEQAGSARAFEAERADLERRLTRARTEAAAAEATLATSEAQIGDLAAVDESIELMHAQARRLETFERSVRLARGLIEERTREAHQKFARRLADYASHTIGAVTKGRYVNVLVDPTTLAVRARVPETRTPVDVERLSAGTREQAYLVVRLAMARMFAEGIETAPLLLDDPFAFWDDERITSGLPILFSAAQQAQTIVFTTSKELADAVSAQGGHLIDLTAISPLGVRAVQTLDRDEDVPLFSEA